MLRPGAGDLGLWQDYPSTSAVLTVRVAGRADDGLLRRPARRRGPRLRLHLAARPAPQARHPAALRRGVHGPRHARRAHLLDAVRRHPARRRRPDAAGGLPPPVRRAARRLPAPGRRHLLRERPERRRRPQRHDAVGALGPPRAGPRLGRRDRRGRRGAARGVGRTLADRAASSAWGTCWSSPCARSTRAPTTRRTRLRLSTDSRYQRADAPVDERWVVGPNGEPPVGHGLGAKAARSAEPSGQQRARRTAGPGRAGG